MFAFETPDCELLSTNRAVFEEIEKRTNEHDFGKGTQENIGGVC